MIGAIIGDIVGSRFEFDNISTKDFDFWGEGCEFTDDTVMTVAVAETLLYTRNSEELGNVLKEVMRDYSHRYPNVGYGGMFRQWLMSTDPQPYNSFGNGSAMRVSPCGYVAESLDEALTLAKASAEISHNHPEGIKGAQAIAAAIYMAKLGINKYGIKRYIEDNFYKLDFTLDDVKESFHFSEACQDTVPQAIQCFLKANSFEDAIRNSISIGGDSDTIACIAGSIAEAYYGISDEMIEKAKTYLPKCFVEVVEKFYPKFIENTSVERLKEKLIQIIEKYNRINTTNQIDVNRIHVGEIVFEHLDEYGCFKCECGWFCYEFHDDRGCIDEFINGPYSEEVILKPLCNKLYIFNEISGLKDFTKEELNTYYNSHWQLKNFAEEHCNECKQKSWCMERKHN